MNKWIIAGYEPDSVTAAAVAGDPSLLKHSGLVSVQMQKLEDKLVSEFKELGQRAVEQSTTALTEQLNTRLETLEKVTDKIDKISVYGGLDGVLKDLVKIGS